MSDATLVAEPCWHCRGTGMIGGIDEEGNRHNFICGNCAPPQPRRPFTDYEKELEARALTAERERDALKVALEEINILGSFDSKAGKIAREALAAISRHGVGSET